MKRWKIICSITGPILSSRIIQILEMLIGNYIVAQVSYNELAASALTTVIYIALSTLPLGILLAIPPLIQSSITSEDKKNSALIVSQGNVLATLSGILIMILMTQIAWLLSITHQPTDLIKPAQLFFYALIPGILPMLWTSVLQQYLFGIRKQKLVFYYTIVRLILGATLNYIFIMGLAFIPRYGLTGLGIATSISSWIAYLGLLFYVKYQKSFLKPVFLVKACFSKKFTVLFVGLPIGIRMSGELFALMIARILLGQIGKPALAAQQIVSQYILLVTMLAFSSSQTLAILSGKFSAQKHWDKIKRYTWIASIILMTILIIIAVVYIAFPRELAYFYFLSHPRNLVKITSLLSGFFILGAIYQVFDGIRNLLMGSLRGFQKTTVPMLIGLFGLWITGLPLGYFLAHYLKFGALGIMIGITVGIIIATIILCIYFFLMLYKKQKSQNTL